MNGFTFDHMTVLLPTVSQSKARNVSGESFVCMKFVHSFLINPLTGRY